MVRVGTAQPNPDPVLDLGSGLGCIEKRSHAEITSAQYSYRTGRASNDRGATRIHSIDLGLIEFPFKSF